MYVHSNEEFRWVSKLIAEKSTWLYGIRDLRIGLKTCLQSTLGLQKPVVLDVGANIGWFTLLSAANGA